MSKAVLALGKLSLQFAGVKKARVDGTRTLDSRASRNVTIYYASSCLTTRVIARSRPRFLEQENDRARDLPLR